jgi:hypothetical protein
MALLLPVLLGLLLGGSALAGDNGTGGGDIYLRTHGNGSVELSNVPVDEGFELLMAAVKEVQPLAAVKEVQPPLSEGSAPAAEAGLEPTTP